MSNVKNSVDLSSLEGTELGDKLKKANIENESAEALKGFADELGLSEEDFENVLNELENEISPQTDTIRALNTLQAPYADPVAYTENMRDSISTFSAPTTGVVTIDPNTGLHNLKPSNENVLNLNQESDIQKMFINPDTATTDDAIHFKKEMDEIGVALGLADFDYVELFNCIIKLRKNPSNRVFEMLPVGIQNYLRKNMPKEIPAANVRAGLEHAARELINFFNEELFVNKAFDDFNNAVSQLLNVSEVGLYLDHLKDNMEVGIVDKALEFERDGDLERAKTLREISEAFKKTYSYELLYKKIENKPTICKELTKELKHYDNYCRKFNSKYVTSNLVINNIQTLLPLLDRKLPMDIHIDDIKKFIILVCKICQGMSPTVPKEHTYMYYTVRNLLMLDSINDETEFSKILINNTEAIIRKIASM